ncbi:uncharacterized protein LOC117322003 [Pecten maximus]|uniref:uncharacterized protein LOC117322003 n=1 Tax=Pecten maximus TaxID=6579 RepID=UPI0014586C72|nr:uncharacterized protein LOC117322003 [Pecten maximus]
MDPEVELCISKQVNSAIESSQNKILSQLDQLMSARLGSLENRLCDSSEAQLCRFQQNILCAESHKFTKKSCEDQHKFNEKVKSKLVEANQLADTEPSSSKAKIAEGIDLINYRQKLVKLADTSEAGWKAVEEYVANPIASDSDDEKKIDRARARANKKLKANKSKTGRGRSRYTPYDDTRNVHMSTIGQDNHKGVSPRSQRPGMCFACGKPGHWRMECPAILKASSSAGVSKISIFCNSVHVCIESVCSNESGSHTQGESSVTENMIHNVSANNDISKEAICSPVGRLRTKFNHWEKQGTCNAVLAIIREGYRIPFRDVPPFAILNNNKSARENPEFVQSEIQKLLRLKCISEVASAPDVVNPLTVAYNKADKPRLVLDCRHINLFLHKFKFKYEDVKVARDMMEVGDFMYTFDLKSAYHHIEIFPEHRTYLGFSYVVNGKMSYYVFNVLPFGIATAGYVFTKVLREVVKHVRSKGYKLVMYLDDGIGGQATEGGASEASRYVQQSLADYGFIIAQDKCEWQPTQFVTWLGYTWSMSEGVVRVTNGRVERLLLLLDHTMTRVTQRGQLLFSARYVAGIIGRIISMQTVIGCRARLSTRELYTCLLSRVSWNACVMLTNAALDEIEFWLLNLRQLNDKGSKLKETRTCTAVVCTDASGIGFGGYASSCIGIPFDDWDLTDNTPVIVALEDNGFLSPCEGNPVMGNCVSNVGLSTVASMVADEVSGLGLRQVVQNAVRGSGVKEGSFLDRLSSGMAERILLSKSENTNCKYYGAFKRWETFISSHGFPALPASPVHVALYMNNLLDKGSTYSVLSTAMYAIKWAHNVSGHTDPTTNTFVISLVEASKRVAKKPVCKKAPVTTDILITLCSMFSQTEDLLIVRDLTMMLICFSGFLRFSELSGLRCSDVKMFQDYFYLVIRKSKTDQYHQGNKVFISKGSTSACPHTMLKRYIERAGIDLKSDEYLFKQVYRSGSICKLIHKNKPISYTGAREAIIKRLKLVSDGKEFGLHSLRAGVLLLQQITM